MSASKLQRNWVSVGFTPSGGVLAPITRVTNCDFDLGGKLIKYFGDGDIMPDTIVAQDCEPSCTLESGDIANLMQYSFGTTGTFTATHSDAKLAVGGAISYTLINAVVKNVRAKGPRGQYGGATMEMDAFSTDGVTNPLSFTRV